MQECWEGEPNQRPYFGDVEATLKNIYEKDKKKAAAAASVEKRQGPSDRSNHALSRHHSKRAQPHR